MPWPLTTVSAFQYPSSWRLYTDLPRLRIDFPLLYLPRVFLSLRGSFLCGAAPSDCHLPGISHRSSGRWYASLASSARRGTGNLLRRPYRPQVSPMQSIISCKRSIPRWQQERRSRDFFWLCADSRSERRTYRYSSFVSPATPCLHFFQSVGQFLDNLICL